MIPVLQVIVHLLGAQSMASCLCREGSFTCAAVIIQLKLSSNASR